jgi:hypothetical protein
MRIARKFLKSSNCQNIFNKGIYFYEQYYNVVRFLMSKSNIEVVDPSTMYLPQINKRQFFH